VNGREISATTLLRRGDRIFLGEATIFKLDWLTEDEVKQLQLANVDSLTEVYNRRFFDARLTELFALARERDRPLSLVMLDIDHFKQINDTFGHLAGDLALQRVAAALQDAVDPADTEPLVCRYGGEEFAILLPGVALDDAQRIAERARVAIDALRVEYHGAALRLTLSAGVASLPADAPESLVKTADDNLYRAKRDGRNRVV
jgi:two-component system cell cycle response regulator